MTDPAATLGTALFLTENWVARWEPAFNEVLHQLQLTEGFAFFPIEVESPDVVRAMTDWLRERDAPCALVRAHDAEAWFGLSATLSNLSLDGLHAVVVSGPTEILPEVTASLRVLNQHRDAVSRQLGCPLLWCGSAEFMRITAERAPDLWSVREVPMRLELATARDKPRESTPNTVVAPSASALSDSADQDELVPIAAAARAQGDWRSAVRLELREAERALGRNPTAVRGALERARMDLPDAGTPHEETHQLKLLDAFMAYYSGDRKAFTSVLNTVDASALSPELRLRWMFLKASEAQGEGRLDAAVHLASECADLGVKLGYPNAARGARILAAGILLDLGRLVEAESAGRQIMTDAQRAAGDEAVMFGAWVVGTSLAGRDRRDEARRWFERAFEAGRSGEVNDQWIDAAQVLVGDALRRGRGGVAERVTRVVFEKQGLPEGQMLTYLRLARVSSLANLGRVVEAGELFDRHRAEFEAAEPLKAFLDCVQFQLRDFSPSSAAERFVELLQLIANADRAGDRDQATNVFETLGRAMAHPELARLKIYLLWNALIRRANQFEHQSRLLEGMTEAFDVLGAPILAFDALWLACACAVEANMPSVRSLATRLRERENTFEPSQTRDQAQVDLRVTRLREFAATMDQALVVAQPVDPPA